MTAPENPLAGYGTMHRWAKAKEIECRLEIVSSFRDPFADAVAYTPAIADAMLAARSAKDGA